MSRPAISSGFLDVFHPNMRQLCAVLVGSALIVSPFLIWPRLTGLLLASNFLPHLYCYLRSPGLVWTHVIADALIGVAYFSISITRAP